MAMLDSRPCRRHAKLEQIRCQLASLVPQLERGASHDHALTARQCPCPLQIGLPGAGFAMMVTVDSQDQDTSVGQLPLAIGPATATSRVDPRHLALRCSEAVRQAHDQHITLVA